MPQAAKAVYNSVRFEQVVGELREDSPKENPANEGRVCPIPTPANLQALPTQTDLGNHVPQLHSLLEN